MVFICSACGEWFRSETEIYYDDVSNDYICTHCVEDDSNGN